MWCKVSKGQAEDSGEHPCDVCRKGVGDNSILCVECLRWVHKSCSGISVKLKSNVVIEPNVKLECVLKFCYLGDTLGAGGGVEEAARASVRCVWAKFKELPPVLTVRGATYFKPHKGKDIQSMCPECVDIWD